MIDLVFLAHNRMEFTRAALAAMERNTDWSRVSRVVLYDDNSSDGTRALISEVRLPVRTVTRYGKWGSPVAVMLDYLGADPAALWAKLDNDTMLPPGWLPECLSVMDAHPSLELLGIEAMRPVGDGPRGYIPAPYIGGIGLFRASAWANRPRMLPNGRFGFTAWQDQNRPKAGWLNPALPVCLLDRVPVEPWRSLSVRYVAAGWQRKWTPYDEKCRDLWRWF